jgi:hypothetical protein
MFGGGGLFFDVPSLDTSTPTKRSRLPLPAKPSLLGDGPIALARQRLKRPRRPRPQGPKNPLRPPRS